MIEYLEIGQIVNTNGLKGVVKIKPFTDDITRFDELKSILVENKKVIKEYIIENVRYQKDMVFIKFKEINSIEEAEKLKGAYLKVNRADEKPLPEDTFYIVDLIGLEVFTVENEYLGIIDDIFKTGSNDVYVVKNEGKQILIPALKQVIKQIDFKNKRIEVELIEGLI